MPSLSNNCCDFYWTGLFCTKRVCCSYWPWRMLMWMVVAAGIMLKNEDNALLKGIVSTNKPNQRINAYLCFQIPFHRSATSMDGPWSSQERYAPEWSDTSHLIQCHHKCEIWSLPKTTPKWWRSATKGICTHKLLSTPLFYFSKWLYNSTPSR